ncbi:MAG: N-acetyltransferase [Thaumarchaeota archaeon]|jgi:hypothetical protein|nr:MAG: N-acetyltransferase [Nitrososphaerota archaeon]
MMKNDTISVKLRPVKKSDCDFLYDLLKEKDPRANISHKMMPSFSQHVKFVLSKPYSKWYVIEVSTNNIGSIYLTQNNEIGISIKNDFEAKEIISQIINLLIKKHPRSKYFVNVNPKNGKYIQFLKNHKFHLIQHTYQLDK